MANATGDAFWSQRVFYILGSYPTDDWKAAKHVEMTARQERLQTSQGEFFKSDIGRQVIDVETLPSKKAHDLFNWAVYKSWSYCDNCKLLHREKLLPSFKNSKLKTVKSCPCKTARYHIPRAFEIPICLRSLTRTEVLALRPFTLHTGNYKVHRHGYRQKDGFCRVSWSTESVLEKIAGLEAQSRLKCMLAYRYLTTSANSRYNHFVSLREDQIQNGTQLNLYDYRENSGIECALWPHLYPFLEWCETCLSGNNTRQSAKVSFSLKILSEVLDYALDYDLLQFVYDRWLFTTVSGAISTARYFSTSAATSLSTKTFSLDYWRWHHRYLVDAVRQYGFPDVFITISPYEWTFPTPQWLQNAADMSGKMPTQLASLETLNIAHILEQTVRGYICGTNSMRWTHHIFHYAHTKNKNNVRNLFYRIEFQGRGTAHIHLLVWLEDISKCSYEQINAHVPLGNRELSFLVHHLQASDKTVLNLNDTATRLATDENGKPRLSLHYPQSAFCLNLRAYLSSIVPFLKCRMDVQLAGEGAMLMRYVTSYVSKFKDSQTTEALYSTHLQPAQAAYRHLRDMKPCEPEMIMSLSSQKMAWCSNSTKSFVPPRPSTVESNVVLKKYHNRTNEADISFLDYLRTHDTSKAKPPLYKRQICLVGIKYVSYFNPEFFFQYLIMNKPHKDLKELRHPNHESLPADLKYFAACIAHIPEAFTEQEIIKMLQPEGHKRYFVLNVINHVQNLRNVYHLWQMQVLKTQDFFSLPPQIPNHNLNPKQTAVVDTLTRFLALRARYYNYDETISGNADSSTRPSADSRLSCPSDWTKIISVTGKPGTGKTKCLHACIQYIIEKQLRCLVATPTGFLASSYRALFDTDIDANTVHSSFSLPIDDSPPKINWSLSTYDVIIIDEVSMVPIAIFTHIMTTLQELSTRPIFMISGDKYQLPPICTQNNTIANSTSIYDSECLTNVSYSYHLTEQYRCIDQQYSEILDHLRTCKPTKTILDLLQHGRLLTTSAEIDDTKLLSLIRAHASSTFLTVSRNAVARINNLILRNLLPGSMLLGAIQMDNDQPPSNIFRGMRVIITQNRDKKNGIVNGQPAIVTMTQGQTVILQLPNGKKVSVYPVSAPEATVGEDGAERPYIRTCYPIVPGYAMTIFKSQGQTLDNVVVWFDTAVLGPGVAYVALSRVKTLANIKFLTPLLMSHFQPVTFKT